MSGPVAILRTPLRLPPREQIEAAIETMVALLDALDPDPDAEETGCEDDFTDHRLFFDTGPGCPVSDSGGDEHDGREPEDSV